MGPVAVAAPVGAPRRRPAAVGGLGRWLDLAEAHAASSATVALAAGLAELEPIELPPMVGTPDEQLVIRDLAPMYFVSELERAGLLRSAETLAALFVSGGIRQPLAPAVADELVGLWRRRHTRFSATEREALFRRLFATSGTDLAVGAANTDFDLLMARVADHMISVGEGPALSARTGLSTAARELTRSVADHAAGVPRLAGRELLAFVRSAVSVLDHPSVASAFGKRSIWEVVHHLEAQAGRTAPVAIHVRRARSGLVVLGWLADHLGAVHAGRVPPITPEVVSAAIEWLDATLLLWGDSGP